MPAVPRTNVVGIFESPWQADYAAAALRAEGFRDRQIGVTAQAGRAVLTVEADGRHGEAAASLERHGARDVQRVAR